MRKQIIILLAILSVLVSGCNKNKEEVKIQLNRDYFGNAQALKNSELWKPLIYATSNVKEPNYIYIEMAMYDKQSIQREVLSFSKVAKKEGYNAIKNKDTIENVYDENNIRYYSSYYTLVADGDVICSSYQVDDSTEVAGYVNVTKYDEKSGIVEGTFEVTLIKERSCDTDLPNILHFTEGVFSTKIQD